MTCRDQLLSATRYIVLKGKNEFSFKEVMEYMRTNNLNSFKESTIRTHLTSRCCINSNRHHGTVYHDYERIEEGSYRVLNR